MCYFLRSNAVRKGGVIKNGTTLFILSHIKRYIISFVATEAGGVQSVSHFQYLRWVQPHDGAAWEIDQSQGAVYLCYGVYCPLLVGPVYPSQER